MKTLEKNDARKVDKKTLQYLRDRAITLRESGISNIETAKILGVSKTTTSRWYSKCKKEGKRALKVQKVGRPKNSGKTLSDEQEQIIIRLLVTKNPKQLQFKFALWTREAVKALILHELNIDMPISTVGDYLAKWQFTSKKPIKRAYERRDIQTKQWLEEEYPRIKTEAKKDSADIWWCDETACVSLPTNLKGYALIGSKSKPVLEHPAKRFKINMISAITNTGKSMFALYDEAINIESFIEFCEKVIESNGERKVYLIVDNLRVHHAKRVKEWEEQNRDKIRLFYLPPYSPEYNPDEYLNQHYKRNANKNNIPKDQKELRSNTEKYIRGIINNPTLVASFFQHQSVRYAG
jgi:transposase